MGYEQSGGFLQSCMFFWKLYLALQKRLKLWIFCSWPRRDDLKTWDASPVFCQLHALSCLVSSPSPCSQPSSSLSLAFSQLTLHEFAGLGQFHPLGGVKPYLQAATTWWAGNSKFVVRLCIKVLVHLPKFLTSTKIVFGIFGQNHPLDKSLTQNHSNFDTIPKITHSPTWNYPFQGGVFLVSTKHQRLCPGMANSTKNTWTKP